MPTIRRPHEITRRDAIQPIAVALGCCGLAVACGGYIGGQLRAARRRAGQLGSFAPARTVELGISFRR
jgi:hypothetical protein